MMVAIIAIGMELGWIVWWEQRRVQRHRTLGRQILTEAAREGFPSDFSGYASPQEAVAASLRVGATARMWSEGWPSLDVIAFGLIVVVGVVGLAIAINKTVT